MSKPSQELLRRAREFASQRAVFQLSDKEILVSPLLAAFAEQIVRECSEIAQRGIHRPSTIGKIPDDILRKFGLKE